MSLIPHSHLATMNTHATNDTMTTQTTANMTTTELRFTFYTNGKPGLECRAVNLPELLIRCQLSMILGPWAETTAAGEMEAAEVRDPQGNAYTVRW